MRNSLRTISKIFVCAVISAFYNTAFCAQACPEKEHFNNAGYNADVVCEDDGQYFLLSYMPKTRKIKLVGAGPRYTFGLTAHALEKNANPELVGEEGSIKFITPSLVRLNNRNFIALNYSERSMRGNGGGQCGAGSEVVFSPIEVFGNKAKFLGQYLVHSCIQSLYLDGADGNHHSIEMNGNTVVFRWLTYQEKDGPIAGHYDFLKNKLLLNGAEATPLGSDKRQPQDVAVLVPG